MGHWLADMYLVGFASAFTMSPGNCQNLDEAD